MKALAEPGSSAIQDPTRDDGVIVRTQRSGISLGRGAHPVTAARELLRLDLATRVDGAGAPAYALSKAGHAHLRRAAGRDSETQFRDQHLDIVEGRIMDEEGPITASIDANESPLAWLRRRKDRDGQPMIDAAAFEAGERLRRDLTRAGILPSITARWEGAVQGGGGLRDPAAATDAMIGARQRVRAALGAVGGDFADLLVDLCGFLKGLERIERERRWPPRSAKVVVGLALGRLARHYGLAGEARGPAGSGGLRVWQADDEPLA